MTNVYSFDGIVVFGLLFICTCAYLKKVPRLNTWLLSEKKGVWGVFYKAAVIGTRLHIPVALSCLFMAFYVMFLKWWRFWTVVYLNWKGASWTGLKRSTLNIMEHLWDLFKRQDESAVPSTGDRQYYFFNNVMEAVFPLFWDSVDLDFNFQMYKVIC